MQKLRLDLDELTVESFDTARTEGEKGTVHAAENVYCCYCCCCPCCCTCAATCPNTCAYSCYGTCYGYTCEYDSCGGSCYCLDTNYYSQCGPDIQQPI